MSNKLQHKLFWNWDHSTNWKLNVNGIQNTGVGNYYTKAPEVFETDFKRMVDFAAANGIKIFFNSMLEEGITQAASLSLAAGTANLMTTIGHSFFSPLRLDGDITDFETRVINGVAHVSDAPGLGFQINEENLKKYTVKTSVVE